MTSRPKLPIFRLSANLLLLSAVTLALMCLETDFGSIVNGRRAWINLGFGWIDIAPLLLISGLLSLADLLFSSGLRYPAIKAFVGAGLVILVGGLLLAIPSFAGLMVFGLLAGLMVLAAALRSVIRGQLAVE